MTIEILYPEVANIFGDYANVLYLEKSVKNAKFIYTHLNEEPYFNKNKVDMIYLGSMSEEFQEIVVEKLKKYKKSLTKCIEDDVIVLFCGMANELVGNYILENNKKVNTLGLFDLYFKRDKSKRNNSLFIGEFNDLKIVGNKSSFTYMYDDKNKYPFIKKLYGSIGNNIDSDFEGIHYKNFFSTSLLGPILVLNPYFTLYLIKLKNKEYDLIYKDDMVKSYNDRLLSLENRKSYIL